MPHIDNNIKLDFKDVLIRPKRSTIRSRADVSWFCIFSILALPVGQLAFDPLFIKHGLLDFKCLYKRVHNQCSSVFVYTDIIQGTTCNGHVLIKTKTSKWTTKINDRNVTIKYKLVMYIDIHLACSLKKSVSNYKNLSKHTIILYTLIGFFWLFHFGRLFWWFRFVSSCSTCRQRDIAIN